MIELILSNVKLRKRDQLVRDAELARVVQMNLIPRSVPDVAGFEVATRYRPASQLGGDLFECVLRPDGRLVVAVADVTGKGTAAALVMAAARTSVKGAAFRGGSNDAVTMLNRVTDDLYDDLNSMGRFMTLALAVIDPAADSVSLANAGHSPVVVALGNEPSRILEAQSPPVGVLPLLDMERQSIPFDGGDVLVIASDGFPEAVSRYGELYGYDRMLDLVDRSRALSANEIAHSLMHSVDAFADGADQSDDQALVIVKRRSS
jgi:sigma-B regulation protein RsbU (phosphoserine phosphatase)